MNDITIVMIAKDEHQMFDIFFEKYIDYHVPIVIVDMNSSTETLAIYDKYKCDRLKIVKYNPENLLIYGYAHPRNFGASHVSTKWILSLDADEYITVSDFTKIWNILATTDKPSCSLTRNNYDYSDNQLVDYDKIISDVSYKTEGHRRIYRNLPNIRWEGYIHEELFVDNQSAYFNNSETDVIIHHFDKYRHNVNPIFKTERYSWMILNAKLNVNLQFGTNAYWFNRHILDNCDHLLNNANSFALKHDLRTFTRDDLNV